MEIKENMGIWFHQNVILMVDCVSHGFSFICIIWARNGCQPYGDLDMKILWLGNNDKAFYALIVHLTSICETICDPDMPHKTSLISINISRNKHETS
jgi:hypothetical protein